MILQRITTRGGAVLLRFPCPTSSPGQCVTFAGKYFVIAHQWNGIASVVTSPKSAIDMPVGTHVDLSPVGTGFALDGDSIPVVVTGGLGFAAGLSLVHHFIESRRDYRMVAYTRHPAQVDDVMSLLAVKGQKVKVWNTSLLGRPDSPLAPVDAEITQDTPVFFAGPRELQDALRCDLDKRGLSGVKIRNNY